MSTWWLLFQVHKVARLPSQTDRTGPDLQAIAAAEQVEPQGGRHRVQHHGQHHAGGLAKETGT